MADDAATPGQYTAERYLEMAECGILSPDDKVELLDGMIVAMMTQTPWHSSTVYRVQHLLEERLGNEAVVRVQMAFVADGRSVPEPDVAVVSGRPEDYYRRHPDRAHLLVEVADSSVAPDRLTKAAIYARAGIPCYWIVNLVDLCVEVFEEPDTAAATYRSVRRAADADLLTIASFPDRLFMARELLPPPDALD